MDGPEKGELTGFTQAGCSRDLLLAEQMGLRSYVVGMAGLVFCGDGRIRAESGRPGSLVEILGWI